MRVRALVSFWLEPYGLIPKGMAYDLPTETVEGLEQRAPGTIERIETHAMDAPPRDRMVRRAQKRGA